MRIIAVSLCALELGAGPAIAEPGNPISGVGVSVEADGNRTMVQYNNANDARADCQRARGTWTNTAGRLMCQNPRVALRGRTIAVDNFLRK